MKILKINCKILFSFKQVRCSLRKCLSNNFSQSLTGGNMICTVYQTDSELNNQYFLFKSIVYSPGKRMKKMATGKKVMEEKS